MSELGRILRETRESKGLSIEDVARETRIKPRFLQAIEEGDFEDLPGQVFAKGFIRNYAKFLGLDPVEMLRLYREEIAPPEEEPETPVPSAELPLGRTTTARIFRNFIPPLVAVLILGFLGWLVYQRYPGTLPIRLPSLARPAATSTPTLTPTPWSPTPTSTPVPSPTPTPSPSPTPFPSPTPTRALVILNLKAQGRSWLEVKVNGELIYQGFIQPGESLVWSGRVIYVKCGNAGALKAIVNGTDIGFLGEEGEVLNLEWRLGRTKPIVLTPTPKPESSPEIPPTSGAQE